MAEGTNRTRSLYRDSPHAGRKPQNESPPEKPAGLEALREKHRAEREAMIKSHETERRDLSGNQLDQIRQMARRHNSAHRDLAERQQQERQR
jgi:hypothetical protein